LSACAQVSIAAATSSCTSAAQNLGLGSCASVTVCQSGGLCTNGSCDARTAAMIAAGCNPCGVQAGATVSVTDALGTVATIILKA
jgi:hypothetical protein